MVFACLEIYLNFCVEVKLHLSNPYTKEHNSVALGIYWDSMASHSTWKDLLPIMFSRRQIISSGKSRDLEKKRKAVTMDDHPRFQLFTDDAYEDLEDIQQSATSSHTPQLENSSIMSHEGHHLDESHIIDFSQPSHQVQ